MRYPFGVVTRNSEILTAQSEHRERERETEKRREEKGLKNVVL